MLIEVSFLGIKNLNYNVRVYKNGEPIGYPGETIDWHLENYPIELPEDNLFSQMIQKVNITADLGRTPIFELGGKPPYRRYKTFPKELTRSEKFQQMHDYYGGMD